MYIQILGSAAMLSHWNGGLQHNLIALDGKPFSIPACPGLRITLAHYTTFEAQQRMLEILQFKLDVLWTVLDAISMAYELKRPPYHTVTDANVWHRGIAL